MLGPELKSAWTLSQPTARSKTSPCFEIRFRLTPNSDRNAIEGLTETANGPAFKARIRAIPENGKANKAMIALAAKWLSVPKSSITLSAGGKSRQKLLSIFVQDPSEIDRIAAFLSDRTDKPSS